MKCIRHKRIRKQKREKENKKMCSRTTQKEKPKRKFTQNRDWENEFVLTYHSCELAYFNPSMTVLYICTPLARLNKGANAVVLEVNCFKVCLSAMMKSCVVRVKCDDQRSSSLALPRSRSSRGIVFLVVFSVPGERTRRSLVFLIFFFCISSNKNLRRRVFFVCVSAPSSFPLHLSLSLSFFLSFFLERTKKATLKSFDAFY